MSSTGRRTYDQAFPESSVGVPQRPVGSGSYSTEPYHRRGSRSQVDGLATVSVDDDDVALYGASSTIAFVREVASEVDSQGQLARENSR